MRMSVRQEVERCQMENRSNLLLWRALGGVMERRWEVRRLKVRLQRLVVHRWSGTVRTSVTAAVSTGRSVAARVAPGVCGICRTTT